MWSIKRISLIKYIVATFFGDDTFSHIISTSELPSELKQELELSIQGNPFTTFAGDNYFCAIQEGVVTDKSLFPVEIAGMIDIYLD